jgi:hypothetical protein
MKMEEMIFVIEGMFPGIVGGTDYLIQETVDIDTGDGLNDAQIIKWELPICKPSQEDMEEFFEQVKEEFSIQKNMFSSNRDKQEEERRQKIVEGYLGNA